MTVRKKNTLYIKVRKADFSPLVFPFEKLKKNKITPSLLGFIIGILLFQIPCGFYDQDRQGLKGPGHLILGLRYRYLFNGKGNLFVETVLVRVQFVAWYFQESEK